MSVRDTVSPESLQRKGFIRSLRENWNDILIRQLPGISLNLGEVGRNWLGVLDFSEIILLLFLCLFVYCLYFWVAVNKQGYFFSNQFSLANVQCLLKRKRLYVKKCTPYTNSTDFPKLILNLTQFRIVSSVQ